MALLLAKEAPVNTLVPLAKFLKTSSIQIDKKNIKTWFGLPQGAVSSPHLFNTLTKEGIEMLKDECIG